MIDRRAVGVAAERQGIGFLKQNGYKIIEHNFRTPYGELDVIAEKDSCIVFIEVKCRRTAAYGQPFEAVDRRKQEHIIKSALHFLKTRSMHDRTVRFDVLSIGPDKKEIELIVSAFTASSRYTY